MSMVHVPAFGGLLRIGGYVAVCVATTVAFLAPAAFANAANLSFSPASGTYSTGQTFTVGVAVNSDGSQVNTAQGVITFNPSVVTVVSISRDGSPLNLWVEEPSFSNSAGTITFSGGATTPLSGTRNIFSITFRAVAQGTASVGARDIDILAGAGQDVTGTIGSGSYTITAAAAPTPTPTPQPAPTSPPATSGLGGLGAGITPQAPNNINSATHAESDEWYATSTATFSWSVPSGIVSVRTLLDDQATSTPTETQTPPIATITYEDIEDGIWYFHLAFENRNGWGEAAHRRIQIDTVPPEAFDLRVEGGDLSAELFFETEDSGSGLAEYVIEVNGVQRERITPNDLVDGQYTLTNLTPGEATFTVIAIDRAGNTTSAEASALITGELPSATQGSTESVSPFGPVYWVSLIFAALLAIVIGMLIFERRRFAEEKDRIKIEAVEAGERLVSIFDVLREELEEKILTLSHKPNMTDTERQTLQSLKEALDISEELLDKEIEDVRKLVK